MAQEHGGMEGPYTPKATCEGLPDSLCACASNITTRTTVSLPTAWLVREGLINNSAAGKVAK